LFCLFVCFLVVWEPFKTWQTTDKKVDVANLVQSHHFANSTVAIMTLFANTNYHWSMCWIICLIPFVRLSFPSWIWRRVTPYS
jgi:hypothetical protein